MKKINVFCLLFFLIYLLPAQNQALQTELTRVKNLAPDTAKVKALNDLSIKYFTDNNNKSSMALAEEALLLAEKLNFKRGICGSLFMLGNILQSESNFGKALDYYFRGLGIAEKIRSKEQISVFYSGIATVYFREKNFTKALEYYAKNLKMEETLQNKMGVARALTNTGNVYKSKGDSAQNKNNYAFAKNEMYPIALDYFLKGLALAEELGSRRGIEVNLGNIGSVYSEMKEYDLALKYLNRSMRLSEADGDKMGMAIRIYNIASLKGRMADEIKNPQQKQNMYMEAAEDFKRSMDLSEEINDKEGIMECSKIMSHIYTLAGDYKQAFASYKKYIQVRDTIFSTENSKKMMRAEMNYELKRKEVLAEAERKKHEVIIMSISAILFLVMVLGGFAYYSFLQKRKANVEIVRQKEVIEFKQNEILDSMRYAKRIQTSLLPSDRYVGKLLMTLKNGKDSGG